MDLALNNLQKFICHQTQTTNQNENVNGRRESGEDEIKFYKSVNLSPENNLMGDHSVSDGTVKKKPRGSGTRVSQP